MMKLLTSKNENTLTYFNEDSTGATPTAFNTLHKNRLLLDMQKMLIKENYLLHIH